MSFIGDATKPRVAVVSKRPQVADERRSVWMRHHAEGSNMNRVSLFPGVTAPGIAVLGGVWLVHNDTAVIGVGLAAAGLAAWSYVN